MHVEIEELKNAVNLLHKAVGEAVEEINDLAKQLSAHAAEGDEIGSIAADIKASAEKLHGAVFPPSANVPLD